MVESFQWGIHGKFPPFLQVLTQPKKTNGPLVSLGMEYILDKLMFLAFIVFLVWLMHDL